MTTHAEDLHATVHFEPMGLRLRQTSLLLKLWLGGLVLMLVLGGLAAFQVLRNGLIETNLTNALPWGLWITVDLSSIGLGAGAFTLSAAVYLFGLKRFEAIARAAVFVGLLGYSSAMLALFLDIGRYDRFYHPIIYWNIHSVLWEITLCVVLYTTVLVTELVPIIIESSRRLRTIPIIASLASFLHRLMPVVATVGMGLSLLHQSSLGATYGILTARPVWYSPAAPVLFILSAVAAGPALTLMVTIIIGKLLNREMVPGDVIDGVAKLIGFACLAYLYLKLWSWAATNYYSHVPEQHLGLEILAQHTPYNFAFWFGEVLFGAVVPAVFLLWRRMRINRNIVILACLMIIAGLVINRWNMTLSGFIISLDWSPGVRDIHPINYYEPALVEWLVSMGIVALAWFAMTLGVRFLNLYPEARVLAPAHPAIPDGSAASAIAQHTPRVTIEATAPPVVVEDVPAEATDVKGAVPSQALAEDLTPTTSDTVATEESEAPARPADETPVAPD